MARAGVCVLAAAAFFWLLPNLAFVQAPSRVEAPSAAVAGAAVIASTPMAAEAFVYKGKEYFDVFYGIEPLAWATCGFAIVYYGALLKNSAQKYNKPASLSPPPKIGGFRGKEA
ncbi:unnamed protein product, partial [Effrenium voratum]